MSEHTPSLGPTDRLARAREALAAAEAETTGAFARQGDAGPEQVSRDGDTPGGSPSAGTAERAVAGRRGVAGQEVPESVRDDREPAPHDVARQIALRQLTMAPRSRKQLEDKLRQKGCADEVSREVLDRLEEVGLIDDAAYAHMLVRARQEAKGLAPRALTQELRRKGVADELIEDALADVDPEDDEERARQLVDKKVRTMRGLDRQVQTRRLAGLLGRKGYDSSMAFRIIREALDALPEHQRD